MIERHEQCVGHNTQRDKQFNERIEHKERNPALHNQPRATAVPHAEEVNALQTRVQDLLAHGGTVIVVIIIR